MWLLDRIENYGESVAFIRAGESYSYHDLHKEVKKLDSIIEENQLYGASVAIESDYCLESVAALIALAKNACIVAPILPRSSELEKRQRLEEAGISIILTIENSEYKFIHEKINPVVHPLIESLSEQENAGLILFSSGSTGKPKAMIHDLSQLMNHFEKRKRKNLTLLLFLMFDHIGGINTLLSGIAMGASQVIPEERRPEPISELIQENRIHILPASPTFLNLMMMADVFSRYDFSSVKMITYGTEAMPEALLVKLKKNCPRVKFLQTFGTSETGIATTISRSSSSIEFKIADEDLDYKIVDQELWLRSATQVMGYLNASTESFTKDGWFKTGDLVEVSEDGYLKIVGRSKEMINVGGEKVLPAEVESVLLELDEISDCTVYGKSNAITGQMVTADVVLSDKSYSEKDVKKIIRVHCKERMDAYKVPAKISFKEATRYSERFKKQRLSDE